MSIRKCPICRRPTVEAYQPFCCKRCADVDLQRWFSGAYAVPVVEDEDAASDEDGAPSGQAGRGHL